MHKTYVIGDVHGCFVELNRLLEKIQYHPLKDTLWFTGDLIGRGPNPLQVLQKIMDMQQKNPRLRVVLGNHDLNLIALAIGCFSKEAYLLKDNTLKEVLDADSRDPRMVDWLRCQPLLHQEGGCILTHAGIPPIWTLDTAQKQAGELEQLLRQPRSTLHKTLAGLYGNQPEDWERCHTAQERQRASMNYLTRMRFCTSDGRLDMSATGTQPPSPIFAPWFEYAPKIPHRIFFGHWAALDGKTGKEQFQAIDYGCAWGRSLAAKEIASGELYLVGAGEH